MKPYKGMTIAECGNRMMHQQFEFYKFIACLRQKKTTRKKTKQKRNL